MRNNEAQLTRIFQFFESNAFNVNVRLDFHPIFNSTDNKQAIILRWKSRPGNNWTVALFQKIYHRKQVAFFYLSIPIGSFIQWQYLFIYHIK